MPFVAQLASMCHCGGAQYSGPTRTGGHKTGSKLLCFFLPKHPVMTSFSVCPKDIHRGFTVFIQSGLFCLSTPCLIRLQRRACAIHHIIPINLTFYFLPVTSANPFPKYNIEPLSLASDCSPFYTSNSHGYRPLFSLVSSA